MAHSANFFGVRHGSTKSMTYVGYRGLQVTKERQDGPRRSKSGRTETQCKQLCYFTMLSKTEAALKGLVNHSFEHGGQLGGYSGYYFHTYNSLGGAYPPTIHQYIPNGAADGGEADWLVSFGSLHSLAFTVGDSPRYDGQKTVVFNPPKTGVTVNVAANKVSANSVLGLLVTALSDRRGRQQTAILLQCRNGSYERTIDGQAYCFPFHKYYLYRLSPDLDLNETKCVITPSEAWPAAITTGTKRDYTLTFNNGGFMLTFTVVYAGKRGDYHISLSIDHYVIQSTDDKGYIVNDNYCFAVHQPAADKTIAWAAIIRSYNDGQMWRRSTQRLQPVNPCDNGPWPLIYKTYID